MLYDVVIIRWKGSRSVTHSLIEYEHLLLFCCFLSLRRLFYFCYFSMFGKGLISISALMGGGGFPSELNHVLFLYLIRRHYLPPPPISHRLCSTCWKSVFSLICWIQSFRGLLKSKTSVSLSFEVFGSLTSPHLDQRRSRKVNPCLVIHGVFNSIFYSAYASEKTRCYLKCDHSVNSYGLQGLFMVRILLESHDKCKQFQPKDNDAE